PPSSTPLPYTPLFRSRLAIATRLLTAAALQQSFQPEHLIGASDALRSFVDARWPAAVWRREVPVSARIASPCGARRIAGSIDLLDRKSTRLNSSHVKI